LQVVSGVAASAQELSNSFIREVFEEYECRSNDGSNLNLMEVVDGQEVIQKLQTKLSDLKAVICDRKKQVHNPNGEDNLVEWGEANMGQRGGEDNYVEIGEEDVPQTDEDNICQSLQKNYLQLGNDLHTLDSTYPKVLPNFPELCEGSVHAKSADFGVGILDEFAQVVDVRNDEGDQSQQSNMYVRRGDDPRKRFKSCAK